MIDIWTTERSVPRRALNRGADIVRYILLVSALLLAAVRPAPLAAQSTLIPTPVDIAVGESGFTINVDTVVFGHGKAAATAHFLARELGLGVGRRSASRIVFAIVPASKLPGDEAYRLNVTPKEIRIEASTEAGLFYGAQTLRQLVPTGSAPSRIVPAVQIKDAPRFKWRGLLVDVSRHFFGKPVIRTLIDEMAAYKLNVLHLHLTDDAGWRLEIPGYPKLTEIGAQGDHGSAGKGLAQFFTAADIREIVAYAAERHIIVVPEIDMPGHSGAAARAYPEFFDGNRTFNPAKPEAYAFIRAVFGEVAKLFPAPYIHYGGDEVREENWDKMPEVATMKARLGITSKLEIEGHFGREVAKIIRDLGKRPMAWDEQAQAGAAKDVLIQWWRKSQPEVRDAAVKAGYDVVLSPVDQVYLDYPQAPGEPGAPWEGNDNGPTSLAKILAWEPVPANYSAEEMERVLGVEAAVWTEFIRTERYLQFMTFPRLLAFAEVAWSPRASRDPKAFEIRLQPHIEALRAKGIHVRRDYWRDAIEFMTN